MITAQQKALQRQIQGDTRFRITVTWKSKIEKWGPATNQDGDWLASIGATRYFCPTQFDNIEKLCAEFGLWLAVEEKVSQAA